MTFRVGQKVVCIDDDIASRNPNTRLPSNVPVEGQIYTIRSFQYGTRKTCVRLVELNNPLIPEWGLEPAFNIDRFRPVVERKTSIEVFRALLVPSKQGADA